MFDWDGTLIDSIGTIVACIRTVLAEMDRPQPSEERIRAGIGMGLEAAVENLAPGHDARFFDEIRKVFRRHWLETYSHRPRLFPGVAEMLAELRRRSHTLAVATAKGREGLELDFARTGVGGLFDVSRTAAEGPGKPDPGMLLQILAETGRAAGETLVVGDSVHDVGMALGGGATALGVATGSQPRELLLEAGAIDCLERVTALPGWLDGEK